MLFPAITDCECGPLRASSTLFHRQAVAFVLNNSQISALNQSQHFGSPTTSLRIIRSLVHAVKSSNRTQWRCESTLRPGARNILAPLPKKLQSLK